MIFTSFQGIDELLELTAFQTLVQLRSEIINFLFNQDLKGRSYDPRVHAISELWNRFGYFFDERDLTRDDLHLCADQLMAHLVNGYAVK